MLRTTHSSLELNCPPSSWSHYAVYLVAIPKLVPTRAPGVRPGRSSCPGHSCQPSLGTEREERTYRLTLPLAPRWPRVPTAAWPGHGLRAASPASLSLPTPVSFFALQGWCGSQKSTGEAKDTGNWVWRPCMYTLVRDRSGECSCLMDS